MLGKKILNLALVTYILVFTACNNEPKQNQAELADTASVAIAIEVPQAIVKDSIPTATIVEEEEEELELTDSVNFAKYAVEEVSNLKKAPIDFSSYPEARSFRTRIIEGYKEMEVNFAGHYVAIYFGCGASCIMGFMVDVNDGKIYDLPLGEGKMCFWAMDRALHLASSKLFISSICKQNENDKNVFYIASLWDEEAKEFKDIDKKEFLVSTN
ncbi:MAG: hypothetical protein EOO87_02400 [Pedobacter sp.]|nr:MAG: hypothetical protein EOO87_02400 [Pedobacter sp.]